MFLRLGVVALGALVLLVSLGGQLATSQPLDQDDKNVQINTEVVKRFGVRLGADITCQFRIEIDPLRESDPIVSKTTTCNNMLRFASNGDLGLSIAKFDRTPVKNADSAAVLDALGLSIEMAAQSDPLFSTSCEFFQGSNATVAGFTIAEVLAQAPIDNVWYDPAIDGEQALDLIRPNGAGTFDCRFRLDFFLAAQDVVALAAGAYVFEMKFTTSIK